MDTPEIPVSMIVLAGGRSRRMGRDKADLMLEGRSFLMHQIEKGRALGIRDILISGYRGEDCPYPVIPDTVQQQGPLGGIEACMRRARHGKCLVVTVDTPLAPKELLGELIDAALRSPAPAVVLCHGGWVEPLLSVWDTALLPRIGESLAREERGVFRLLREAGYEVFRTEGDARLSNINTPEDYARLCPGETL